MTSSPSGIEPLAFSLADMLFSSTPASCLVTVGEVLVGVGADAGLGFAGFAGAEAAVCGSPGVDLEDMAAGSL